MHYDGQIYRPPVEANSILLQATIGCSHNSCKFCTMYHGTKFRVSPMSEIEADLQESSIHHPNAKKVFLLGADAFVLSYDKLKEIITKIHKYLPHCESIRMFARIDNVAGKSLEQLIRLREMGLDYLYIGIESGDNLTLESVNKGYSSSDIFEQMNKLENAGIDCFVAHLLGLAGHGNGERNAYNSAKLYNQLKIDGIGATNLILYPDSELYGLQKEGQFGEATELEKLLELKILVENLEIKTMFTSAHASNLFNITGCLPMDKYQMLQKLQHAIDNYDEKEMRFLSSMRRSL